MNTDHEQNVPDEIEDVDTTAEDVDTTAEDGAPEAQDTAPAAPMSPPGDDEAAPKIDEADGEDGFPASARAAIKRARDQAFKSRRRAAEAEAQAHRLYAVIANGLDLQDMDLLGAGSKDEIDSRAKRLADRLSAAPRRLPSQRPTASGDVDPRGTPAVESLDEIGARLLSRRR